MRSLSSFPRRTGSRRVCPMASLLALTLLAGSGLVAQPAHADRLRERAQADSFGNLVVWSRSGYKRIVVGQGHLAAELNAYAGGAPDVADGETWEDEAHAENGDAVRNERQRRHAQERHSGCYRAPAFVQGRSYMYGLADGEMPVLTPCESGGESESD